MPRSSPSRLITRILSTVFLLFVVAINANINAAVKFRATFQLEDGSNMPEFQVGPSSDLGEACSAYVAAHGFPETATECVELLQQRYDMVVTSNVPSGGAVDEQLRLFPDIRGTAVARNKDRAAAISLEPPWWSAANLQISGCQDRSAVVGLAAARSKADAGSMIVVEVGAHNGQDTAAYALLDSVGSVVAYEPTPSKGDIIRARVKASAASNGARVIVRAAAVSNESLPSGILLFTPDPALNDMANSLVNTSFVFGNDAVAPERVPVVTLDADLKVALELGDLSEMPHVALLEVDAQGYDFRVLQGAKALVAAQSLDVILLEFSPKLMRAAGSSPAEAVDFLAAHGYDCFDCRDFEKPTGGGEMTMLSTLPLIGAAGGATPDELVRDLGEYPFAHGDHGAWTDLMCLPDRDLPPDPIDAADAASSITLELHKLGSFRISYERGVTSALHMALDTISNHPALNHYFDHCRTAQHESCTAHYFAEAIRNQLGNPDCEVEFTPADSEKGEVSESRIGCVCGLVRGLCCEIRRLTANPLHPLCASLITEEPTLAEGLERGGQPAG